MRVGAVRRSFAQATLGACILAALLGGTARADTAAFIYTGDDQTFTVPAGVTTIHVIAVGGHGGAGTPGGFAAGAGGEAASVECDLSVTPGRILYVEVAGVGGYGNGVGGGVAGFNGGGNGHAGGGGGGASDIRTSPRSMGLTPDTRLLVAAGGGGGGEGGSQSVGGNGGAEAAGGWFDSAEKNFGGSSGDSGGVGGGSNAGMEYDGSYGQRGTGGAGGDWNRDGGGGGGGLFGGGGGAGGTLYGGGGGGGGSSLVPAGGSKVRADPAATPQILITFTPSSSSSSSPSSGGGTTTVPGVTPLSQLTPQNNFRILTPTVNSTGKILLVLNAPGPGIFDAVAVTTVPASAQRVTVAGRKKKPKRITYGKRSAIANAAGAIQLSISPSKAAKKALKRVKKLKVAVTITFRPVGATPATKKVNVTVKGKKKKRR